jgi:hypothetical protein
MIQRHGLLLLIITSVVLAFTTNCAVAFIAPQVVNSSGHHDVVALQASSFTTTSSSNNNGVSNTRRNLINNFLTITTAIIIATPPTQIAHALDFDAFEKGIITNDTVKCDPKRDPKCIPKLTSDEALCQYGGGGNARGEACKRVRAEGGVLPTVKKEKSLGGAYAM